MRSALLVVMVLAVLSCWTLPAPAGQLYVGSVAHSPAPEPDYFRLSYSPAAYLEILPSPSSQIVLPGTPNVDAFLAELTDSQLDNVTLTSSVWTYTVPENYFWSGDYSAPLFGQVLNNGVVGRIDLAGYVISDVWMRIAPTGYLFIVSGQAPEPTSALLLAFGLCAIGHRYHRRKVRSSSTSCVPVPAVSMSR